MEFLIKEFKSELCYSVLQLQNRFTEIVPSIKAIDIIRHELNSQKTAIDDLKLIVNVIKSEFSSAVNKLIGSELQLQAHSLLLEKLINKPLPIENTNKIIIHGLPVNAKEKIDFQVKEFFKSALQIEPTIENAVIVVTRKKLSYHPILVTFATEFDKKSVFRNCHKLKYFTHKISVWDDLPTHQRKIRKAAVEAVQKARILGKHWKVKKSQVVKPKKLSELTPTITSSTQKKECETRVISSVNNNVPTPILHVSANNSNAERQPTLGPSTSHDNVEEFKKDNAVQLLILTLRKKRLAKLNGTGKEYTGLLARIAKRKAQDRHHCSCKFPHVISDYEKYVQAKKLDTEKVKGLLQRLDEIQIFLCDIYKSRYRNSEHCFCQICSVAELIIDDNYIKLCGQNEDLAINGFRKRDSSSPVNTMFGNLFDN